MRLNGKFPIAAVVLTLAAGLVGCKADKEEATGPERVWPVKVAQVTGSGVVSERHFAGRVRAVQTVDLSFRVGGKLASLPLKDGEIIAKGQQIAVLDDTEFVRRVKEARVNVDLLEKTAARQRELAASQALSAQQLDETESRLALARVALENAQQDLGYTRLTAPFDALVTRRLIENFTNVRAGQAVVRLQDISEVRVEVSVPERLLATVDKTLIDSLSAEFDFMPGRVFPMEYRQHQAEANSVTQTFTVELGMPRPEDLQVLPGMSARVTLRLSAPGGVLNLPLSAVQSSADGTPYVWQIGEDHSVSRIPVDLGSTDGDQVHVLRGLVPGSRVVAAGGQHLYDGAVVRDYSL